MRLREWLEKHDARLARIEADLRTHIRRTEILEAELAPIKTHIAVFTAMWKIGISGLGAAATVLGVMQILGVL